MEAIQFEIRRNKLIDEYRREIHPLWLECQRQMEQVSSHSWRSRLIREFQGKITPRLEKLFTEIARLKLGFPQTGNPTNITHHAKDRARHLPGKGERNDPARDSPSP